MVLAEAILSIPLGLLQFDLRSIRLGIAPALLQTQRLAWRGTQQQRVIEDNRATTFVI